MRKVLFTESQMRQILIKEGLNDWSDINSGYLDTNSNGGEAPENMSGSEVFVDDPQTNTPEKTSVTTADKVSHSISKRLPYGFGSKFTQPVYEDIEQQNFRANKFQKMDAKNSGTKMGQNISDEKKTSNATQRKRKERLNKYKQNMSSEEYKQKYGDIEKMVKSSLKQMSLTNDVLTNTSDLNKLNNANDVTKAKITTEKGHHEGEELSNGRLHYFK